MESPSDASTAAWQQQQGHSRHSPYFSTHPPPGALSNLNPSPNLPYPLITSSTNSSSSSNGNAAGTETFGPIAAAGNGPTALAGGPSMAHRRHNSLAASTSSIDSGFSDLSDPTLQLRSSTRSDNTDSSFDAANTTVTPLRHSRRDLSEDQNHPSGLIAPPTLLDQELHQDGRPRRPMNAFMIYARHRRPEFQKNEPGLKTGDLSKRLSAEWKALEPIKKSFYLDQAKILKDHFHERFPTYVYRRRPNNQGRRSRHARSARGSSGSGRGSSTDSSDSLGSAHSPGSGSPGFVSPVTGDFSSAPHFMSSTGSGPNFRLPSSLSSSTGSSTGSLGASISSNRTYDPPPMLQLSGRHSHEFEHQTWPSTPPQPYSSAPSSANSQLYSPYTPSANMSQPQRWDPTFARSYDSTANPLSRSWSAGYPGSSDYITASQAMPYPYSVTAPLIRSSEQLSVSDADYGRYTKNNSNGNGANLRMSMTLPSPSIVSGTARDAGWMSPGSHNQLHQTLARPESSWSGGQRHVDGGQGAYGEGSGHSSSSESLHNPNAPVSAGGSNNKYYPSQTFNPASLIQQPGDPSDIDSSSLVPPSQQLPAESDSQS